MWQTYSNVSGQHGADFHSSPPWGQALKGPRVHLLGHVIINGESKKKKEQSSWNFLKMVVYYQYFDFDFLQINEIYLFCHSWYYYLLHHHFLSRLKQGKWSNPLWDFNAKGTQRR